ncbi:MAG: hypothetical protein IJW13_00565 [Clostridia bacterium]|nr:hypothetical protein [Clostridia bacterium]
MNYLSFDIGTTGCKCQLFSEDASILYYEFIEYDFKLIENENYVNVDAIWHHLTAMLERVAKKHDISSICISSLGESFVLLDKDDNILFYPMLYTDPRGEDEAQIIKNKIGEDRAFFITGVVPHSMYSLSKLLWIKNNRPDLFAKADKIMLTCDYFGYLLTGKRVIDYSLAARTGAFDIEKMQFSNEILHELGILSDMFSVPMRAGSIVAPIKPEIIRDYKIKGSPVLVLGSHDQVCAALGAGVLEVGDSVDGMGTVECITTLFSSKPTDATMGKQGYPCVPYAVEGTYCTYILNYSCGSTVNWMRKKIMHGYSGDKSNFFDYIEEQMDEGPTGILTLPYFGGASTPYQNLGAKGAIINLTTQTSDCNLYKSLLEGTAFEMRLNAQTVEKYGVKINNAVATGGGANSKKWLQIKADIQNLKIKTLRSSEGGLCGCAMLQAVALKQFNNLSQAKEAFVWYDKEFVPINEERLAYEKYYEKYKKIYKAIKEFY